MVEKRKHSIRTTFIVLLVVLLFFPIIQASSEPSRSVFTVTNTLSEGPGSLRQAILDANSYAGKDYIYFNIPESDSGYSAAYGVWFINLSIVLPMLEDPSGVVIDGSTQPGTPADLPEIIINATGLISGTNILTILTGWNEIRHLGFKSSQGNSIEIDGLDVMHPDADYNIISDNQIFNSQGYGILLNTGIDHTSIVDNKICGHKGDGIYLDGAGQTYISGNVIGIQPDYWGAVLQNEASGIGCVGCSDSTIRDNTISGNLVHGVYFSDASDNLLEDNRIGLSEDGLTAIGNHQFGVLLENGSRYNDIFENWISGNTQDGIRLVDSGTYNNHIESNKIGLGLDGPLPNGWHGVGIYDDANSNHVGNSSDPMRYNNITSNGWSGVVVVNSPAGGNYIVYNHIVYNQYYGVHINNSCDNFIWKNTINGNGTAGTYAGVRIEGSTSLSNAITMNSISQNTGPGIQLVNGGNAGLAAPVITSATCNTVTGTTCPNCTVQIYSDEEDEGRVFEIQTASADGGGHFSYTDYGGFTGPNMTAITFDLDGNTSPFSAAIEDFCFRCYLPLMKK